MNNSALHAVIQEYGIELRIPALVRLYPEITRQARDGGWPYEEFLKLLLESDVNERRDTVRRIRQRSQNLGSNRLASPARHLQAQTIGVGEL